MSWIIGDRTLSGLDNNSINHINLPSDPNALTIDGFGGDKGMALLKNDITNKIEWDFVDKITIPDGSITGPKLATNVDGAFNIKTTGDIECDEITARKIDLTDVEVDSLEFLKKLFSNGGEIDLRDTAGQLTDRWFHYQPTDTTTDPATPQSFDLRIFTKIVGSLSVQNLQQNAQHFVQLTHTTGAILATGQIRSNLAQQSGGGDTQYGLYAVGNAYVGGDLVVVGDIELDTLILQTLTINGALDFQIPNTATPPVPALDRRYLRIRDNGDMFWYDNLLPNSGTPDETTLAEFNRRTEGVAPDAVDRIDFTTNGRIETTNPDNTTHAFKCNGLGIFSNRLQCDNFRTTNTQDRSAEFTRDIIVGRGDRQVGILTTGDIILNGDETSTPQTLRKIIIENRQTGQSPDDPKTIMFEVDNDDITKVKNITTTGNYTSTGNITLDNSRAGVGGTKPILRVAGNTELYNKLNNVQIGEFDTDGLRAFWEGRLHINGVQDQNGTPSLQIGGIGYGTTNRVLDYVVPSFDNGIRIITLEGYGTKIDGSENTTWKIESFDDEGSNDPVRPANESTSRATFNTIEIKGDLHLDANGAPERSSILKGNLIIQPETTSSLEDVKFKSQLGSEYLYKELLPNKQNSGGTSNGSYGATRERANVFYPNLGYTAGTDGNVVSFGGDIETNFGDHPIKITEINRAYSETNSSNAGGIVFGTINPAIRGHIDQQNGNRTRCFNLDLTDPSVLLSTEERTDKICITRYFPSEEYTFPNHGYNWNDSEGLYDFMNLNSQFYVEVNTALTISPIFYNISIEWNVYVEEAIWGEYDGSTNGNADLYYKYVYTTDRDEPSYSVARNLGSSAVFWRSGTGNKDIDGTDTNKLYGGGYNMFFSDIREIPEDERGYNIRIYVQARNDPLGNNDPAFIQLRAGQGSSDRSDWIMKVSPINSSLFRNVVD